MEPPEGRSDVTPAQKIPSRSGRYRQLACAFLCPVLLAFLSLILLGGKPMPTWLKQETPQGGTIDGQTFGLGLDLLWMAPFASGGGYSSEAIAYITALKSSEKVPAIRIAQHGDGFNPHFWRGLPHNTRDTLLRLSSRGSDPANSIVICHSEPGAWHPPLFQTPPCPPRGYTDKATAYVIGRTMFETDRVSPHHVERCNQMDEVWVPSDFHLKTFAKSGVDPVKLVKVVQPVDVDFFDPAKVNPLALPVGQQLFGPPLTSGDSGKEGAACFVFLSIFKWEARKGWDVLVKAYLQEFTGQDSVALYLLTNPYHTDSDFDHKVQAFVRGLGLTEPVAGGWPRLFLKDDHIPQEDLPRLYRAADAFVLPSRGEGWGRPHVEAMAMGLPVIATNWSGMTEYMTADNSYPLEVSHLVEVEEGPFEGHLWAEPSVRHLRSLMRHVYENPSSAKAKGREARKDMVQKYSPNVVSEIVLRELHRVERRVKVATAEEQAIPRSQCSPA